MVIVNGKVQYEKRDDGNKLFLPYRMSSSEIIELREEYNQITEKGKIFYIDCVSVIYPKIKDEIDVLWEMSKNEIKVYDYNMARIIFRKISTNFVLVNVVA